MKKLTSRKLWVAVIPILVTVFNRKLGLGLTPQDELAIVALASAYILGESYIDSQRAAEPLAKPTEDRWAELAAQTSTIRADVTSGKITTEEAYAKSKALSVLYKDIVPPMPD